MLNASVLAPQPPRSVTSLHVGERSCHPAGCCRRRPGEMWKLSVQDADERCIVEKRFKTPCSLWWWSIFSSQRHAIFICFLLWWCLMMTGGASSSVFQMSPSSSLPLPPPASAEAILGLFLPCAGLCCSLYVVASFWTELVFNHQMAHTCFVCKRDTFISPLWNSVINWK